MDHIVQPYSISERCLKQISYLILTFIWRNCYLRWLWCWVIWNSVKSAPVQKMLIKRRWISFYHLSMIECASLCSSHIRSKCFEMKIFASGTLLFITPPKGKLLESRFPLSSASDFWHFYNNFMGSCFFVVRWLKKESFFQWVHTILWPLQSSTKWVHGFTL